MNYWGHAGFTWTCIINSRAYDGLLGASASGLKYTDVTYFQALVYK